MLEFISFVIMFLIVYGVLVYELPSIPDDMSAENDIDDDYPYYDSQNKVK